MCRFTFYMGPSIRMANLVTEPSNSLIHQSFDSHEREEPLNGDGFGVAWYGPHHPEAPAVFRSLTPAWSNPNLLDLARVVETHCVLAHVRAATAGLGVAEANCHPFRNGRYTFMHNGELGGFPRLRRRLMEQLSDESFASIHGTTDSEHMFALLLDKLRATSGMHPLAALETAMSRTIEHLMALSREHGGGEPSYLNMLVCDGERAVAVRFTSDAPSEAESLYLHRGRKYVCEDGVCMMIDPDDDHGAVIVSSERLSDGPGWEPIPVNHLVVIDRRRVAHVREQMVG